MRMRLSVLGLVFGFAATFPFIASAQDASLSGTVTDSTGAVLPGVTVTALHVATGNTFVGVTDGRGNYRIAARTGQFKVTAELSGFGAAIQNLELLVGQQAVVN